MKLFRNPRVEIITIGREILDGRVVDTNSMFMAEVLKGRGVVPRWAQRVDDQADRIVEAFEIAAKRSDFVLITGGLGPTSDDLTAEAFAQFAGEDCELNHEALVQVEDFFKKIGRPMIETQKKQALLPRGVRLMPNPEGSAPGFWSEKKGVRFFFMPGVPREMKKMMRDHVLPAIPAVAGYRSYTWATQFTSEGELQARLKEISLQLPREFEITYRTRFPENHIGLYGPGFDTKFEARFNEAVGLITEKLGLDAFSAGAEIKSLEEIVFDLLKEKNAALVTIESCTGGLIANRITNLSGASEVFLGASVCYDNAYKVDRGVDAQIIARDGAVSPACAKAMAEAALNSALKIFPNRAIFAISTTGIAGPTGGTPEKPVGLCYTAVAHKGTAGFETVLEEVKGRPGWPRVENKNLFSQKGLDLLRRQLILQK